MSQNTVASRSSAAAETTVVDEIPEALNKILLMTVKSFYSNEHYLVVYYIMRNHCIREENLKSRLQFDQKQLRQLLAQLKQEKLVKERLFSQKNDNNRTVSIIFYFINYRAVLNVVRYKVDHMRQRLESREQMDTNRAHYKCTNTMCASTYDMLEINRILNPETGRLDCWRCRSEVMADESVAPSKATRTAVARFNEQMAPLFSHICALNGIQLAPSLLEPDISKYLEDDRVREQLQQQMDFTSGGGGGNRIQLGGVAHSYNNIASINYQHGDQVTVDLNADINHRPVEQAKEQIAWLQDNAIGEQSHNEKVLSKVNEEEDEEEEKTQKRRHRSAITLEFLKEIEGSIAVSDGGEPEAKRSKTEGEQNGHVEEGKAEEEEEEEEEMVLVGGRLLPLSHVTVQMVEEMDEKEQQMYTRVVQELYAY